MVPLQTLALELQRHTKLLEVRTCSLISNAAVIVDLDARHEMLLDAMLG